MLSFEKALETILREITPLGIELCDLWSSHGRVLARDVEAPLDVPPLDNSSMDGYALRSADTLSAGPDHPVELSVNGEVAAGDVCQVKVEEGIAVRIFTGGAVPVGADAVIEQEIVEAAGGRIVLKSVVAKGRNVRLRGEDFAKGQQILGKGTFVNAARLGVLASIGLSQVPVHATPRVAILTTGNELAGADEPLARGKIRDSNSYTLWSLVRESGCEPAPIGRAGDSSSDLKEKMRAGLSADALITSGGASVGEHDLVLDSLRELGVEIKFWKVNIKPGMPFAFGLHRKEGGGASIPVFALPGNPVSTMVTFLQLVQPALLKMKGMKGTSSRVSLLAKMEHDYQKWDGKRHFARGVVRNEKGELLVRTSGSQSSGVLTSLSIANCLIVFPEGTTVVKSGDPVEIELLKVSDS
jgi:molybdopterin molybdotransferase